MDNHFRSAIVLAVGFLFLAYATQLLRFVSLYIDECLFQIVAPSLHILMNLIKDDAIALYMPAWLYLFGE